MRICEGQSGEESVSKRNVGTRRLNWEVNIFAISDDDLMEMTVSSSNIWCQKWNTSKLPMATRFAEITSDSAWNVCQWFGTKCQQFNQSQSSVRRQHMTVCQSGRSFGEIAWFVTICHWQIDICWQACRSGIDALILATKMLEELNRDKLREQLRTQNRSVII